MLVYAWMVFVETAPERYDLGMKIMTWGRLDKIKDMIAKDVKEDDEILDMGCGTGTLALRCMEKGATVTGLDSSEFMLEQAQKNADKEGFSDRIRLIKDSITQTKKHLADKSFSKVMATMSLGEFPKSYLEYIFKECNRVMKEGGQLIIADELKPKGRIARFFYNIIMALVWIPQFVIVRRVCYPIKNIEDILESAGFTVKKRKKFSFSSVHLIYAEKTA